MQDSITKSRSISKRITRRVWFWILISLVLGVVLIFSMLPIGIDYGIESYLKDQGADQVSLEDVGFNPITGRMTLTNLMVTIGTQTVLQIPEATFKIQWTPFVRKRFVLERFTISDTDIIVEKLEDGNWQIGGITIPGKNVSADPASWHFSFQEATATNCKIKLISARLKSDLVIEKAKLLKLTSWLYDDHASLELTGQLNDASMKLKLDVSPFGSEILASGQIKLTSLSLKPFAQLLQTHLKKLEGRLDVDVNIETRQATDSGISHFQKGLVNLQQIQIQTADLDLSKESLAWDGAIRVGIPQSQKALEISAEGQLNGSKSNLSIENDNLNIQQGNLSWRGKINYAQNNTNQKISTDGQITFADLKMESPQVSLAEKKVMWKGALQLNLKSDTAGQRIVADGVLDGSQSQMSLKNRKLTIEHQGLSWKGRLDSGEVNDFSALQTKADVYLKDIQILHSDSNQPLLNSEGATLKAIQVEGLDKINVSGIVFNSLALLTEAKSAAVSVSNTSPFRIQQASFKNVQLLQQHNLAIDAIQLQTVKAFVYRSPQGAFPAIDRWTTIAGDVLSPDQNKPIASDIKDKDTSGEFGFRIGQIDIAGDSGLQVRDESVSPAFGMDLSILEARLGNLDSSRPQQPVSVKLLVSDKEDARISLNGTLQPLAEKLSLDWVGQVEALELPPLSPFVIQNTGYRFVSGELQADVPLKINQNQLDGNIDLTLFNPTVESVKAESTPEENQGKIKISIPLDSALKLLRDKQNNVKLNIPISGDINDPEFSIADAVNKVLVKSLQTSVLSYLKFTLGPYGIGLAVAEQAISGSAKIQLNPILFPPGSDELDEAAIDYAQRVATIMREYPEVQVSVCGVATESDRAAITAGPAAQGGVPSTAQTDNADSTLLTLAEKRSDQIQNQLVNAHGIAAKRIIDCKPGIAEDADANPRVDLEI